MTKIKASLNAYAVIAIANERVSTPTAYRALDGLYRDFDGSVVSGGEEKYKRLYAALLENRLDTDSLFNIFEGAVLPTCEGASKARARLIEQGASAAMMSGSGPSVFGIFHTAEGAKKACLTLRTEGFRAYYAALV